MRAFLGMGHLGSNFVQAMLNKGEELKIWNRTTEKATKLECYGAKVYNRITETVSGVDMIHLTLRDDTTVDVVLAEAIEALKPNAIIIDHTTTSVQGAKDRTKRWKGYGFTYIHAPVFMGPQNALESKGIMLVSGDQAAISGVIPELSKMTGKVINFGAEAGKAAEIKLIGNILLLTLTAGFTDMLLLASCLDTAIEDIFKLFESWNPGEIIPSRFKKIVEANFHNSSWDLNMARKDVELITTAAGRETAQFTILPAIGTAMDSAIKQGFGAYDWTVIAKHNVPPKL